MLNFNSQICTTRKQSERLLALGLKKETADMYWWQETDHYGDGNGKWHRQLLDLKEDKEHFKYLDKTFGICLEGNTDEVFFIPAWSLHRLIEMLGEVIQTDWEYISLPDFGFHESQNLYDNVINCTEWLIKEGYFNNEYLCEK